MLIVVDLSILYGFLVNGVEVDLLFLFSLVFCALFLCKKIKVSRKIESFQLLGVLTFLC